MEFLEALKNRRTCYDIGKAVSIPQEKIIDIVKESVRHTPSAFNSQSARVVVLFGEEHDKLWDITMENLRKIVPADKFEPTELKINSFKAGYGTVLFFDETNTTNSLMEKFALYRENFMPWAEQANGMLQHVIWVALEQEGLGASLQHYNEVIQESVKNQWGICDSWRMIAQMPFGNVVSPPGEKEFMDINERVKVLKK